MADGRTMIGHAVVCRSEDVLAIWHVSTDGVNTNACIVPMREVFDDAARLLGLCAGRALISWAPEEPIALLRRLEQASGALSRPWERHAIALPDVLAEIAAVRTKYVERVAEQQAINKQVVGLEWPIDLPDPLPATETEMCQTIGVRIGEWANPLAAQVLLTCKLVTWTIQRWQETMTALHRREFLRREFGEPTLLAPGWERVLADSYALRGHGA